MSKEDHLPAFPIPGVKAPDGFIPGEHGMQLREYAAIHLRVPDSGIEWLDEMISSALINDFAVKAMQSILATDTNYLMDDDKVSRLAIRQAQALSDRLAEDE